jgi:hypothetical protein
LAGLGLLAMAASGCVTVERVDTSSNGTPTAAGVTTLVPGVPISGSAISGDGRYVAFVSTATDLVPDVDDGSAHVYRKDRATGAIAVADVSSTGTLSAGAGVDAISDDGSRVAFRTASHLVTADVDGHVDEYVHDFTAGTTVLASLMPDGSQTPVNNGVGTGARGATFDGTGTKLYFLVGTGNIPPRNLLEVRDLSASTTTQVIGDNQITDVLVSHDGKHLFANTGCFQVGGCGPVPVVVDLANPYAFTPTFSSGAGAAGISDDGRYLLFQQGSGDPAPIRFDRATGTAVTLAVGSVQKFTVGTRALDGSGRFALVSAPDDALPGGTSGRTGLFLVDVVTGRVERTSADAANRAGNDTSASAAVHLSRDGRTAEFFSDATNLVDGDGNGKQDAFVRVGPTPVVESVTSGTLHRGTSHAQVALEGAEFFAPIFVSVAGDGITVHSVTVNATNDRVFLDVSVAANAPTGSRSVTVANLATVGHAGTICACITVT